MLRQHSDAARGPSTPSLDHLVGAGEHRGGYIEAEGFRGFQIDHQLVFGRRLHGKVGGLLALEDAVDVLSRAAVLVDKIRPERLLSGSDRHSVCARTR